MGKGVNHYEDMATENPAKLIRKIVFGIIGLGMLVSLAFWVFGVFTQPLEVVTKTFDADNIIYNYEWFKQQYNDYEAINKKIARAETSVNSFKENAGERKEWTFEDKNEFSRLVSISDGLSYQKQDIISKYNARSQMANREIFKTNDLPIQLN